MTRKVVAKEGVRINNCVIVPGALRLPEGDIPVNWNGDNSKILGKASNFERNEETNEITAEITLFDSVSGLDLEDQIGGFVYVSPFEAKPHAFMKGAISEVTSGNIKGVSLQDLTPEALPKDV